MTGPNPSGLCMCGCGEKTSLYRRNWAAGGWVKGAPRRYIIRHNSRKSFVEYVEEDRGYETPCWIWQRSIDGKGYGQACVGRQRVGAHRLYYERHVGPIPEGLHIDHLCAIKACVNPDHLEPVTQAENVRRGRATRLTPDSVRAIRASAEPTRVLAERYAVRDHTIRSVRNRESWVDLEDAA
jgi:hypothetical protein